jgi:glycosyltransferase involved in cell wall biosynthesis
MRIAIDLQSCQSGSRFGGIGRYSIELAKAMVRRATSHTFTLVLNDANPDGASYVRATFADLLPPDQILSFAIPRGVSELANHVSKVRAAELIREQFLTDLNPDLLHISSLFEGLQEDIVTSVGHRFPANRTAVTLYDLIPLVQRERYLANQKAMRHYLAKVEHLRRAGLLLAISDFSRNEACELLKIEPTAVVNISSAADDRFKPIALDPKEAEELKRRYGIDKRFVMYTGSFDQRKNHEALVRAFALLPSTTRSRFQLLIVGKGWEAMYHQLRGVADKVGLDKNALVFAGHVVDTDLVPLYNLCDLFVFPSLAEGFGLPVLEAMSCGIPTICSDTTSLPEVIDMEEALFDPKDAGSIAATMNRALTDTVFQQRLRSHGLSRAKQFSWDQSARRAIDAFEAKYETLSSTTRTLVSGSTAAPLDAVLNQIAKVPGMGRAPDTALGDFSRCLVLNHLSIENSASLDRGEKSATNVGWISTWNTRCGIAAYSKFLVNEWPSRVLIFAPSTDWTTQLDEPTVIRCWETGGSDDLETLYQRVLAAKLSVVVIQFNYSFFNFSALSKVIEGWTNAGIRVFVTLHSTHDPAPSKRLADLSYALARCAGVTVHALRDIAALAQLGLRENVTLLPQGIASFPRPKKNEVSEASVKTIATYGFALPNKGLTEVVEAIALLSQQQGAQYQLLMINAEYPDPQSKAALDALNLSINAAALGEKVRLVTEYLPDELSIELLQKADLVIFAYQNTGESSSAAVRMGLASGRPVAVTPLQIFDDVKTCTFSLPGVTPKDISSGILHILKQLEQRSPAAVQIHLNAEQWRLAHSFAKISKAFFLLTTRTLRGTDEYEIKPDYDLSTSSEPLRYLGSDLSLKTTIGIVREGRLVTTARQGHLLYGPYISVASGTYRVTLKGTFKGKGRAVLDVCAKAGLVVFAEVVLTTQHDSFVISDTEFIVPEGGVSDLEIRLEVDSNVQIELTEIKLTPTNNLPQATNLQQNSDVMIS